MTPEQVTGKVLELSEELASVRESIKSAHRRSDDNDRITAGIHKIAASVQALALQVKLLTDKMDESVENLKGSIKNQGERIGALEKEPAQKWKGLVKQVIEIAVAAAVGAALAIITGGVGV